MCLISSKEGDKILEASLLIVYLDAIKYEIICFIRKNLRVLPVASRKSI